jgi:hypothetical protein
VSEFFEERAKHPSALVYFIDVIWDDAPALAVPYGRQVSVTPTLPALYTLPWPSS